MDQPPERISKPPARLRQGLLQAPVILTPAPLPPARPPIQKADVALKVHKVECWVFDRDPPITASTGGTLTTDQITDWLKAPSPTMKGDVRPAVGLRLLCLEQEDSMKWPFDKVTFEAIQYALGLTKTSSYFNLPKSGACGKYLGISGQPIFVYHRSNNNGTISTVLKYDSAANVTTGYALLGPRISLENLGTRICSQFPAFPHPLLVPTVLIELTATDLMRELYHINRLLTQSEYKTQSGDWEIQDTLANADPKLALKAAAAWHHSGAPLAPEDSYWHDETASEMQKEPSYWKDMSREMKKCEDNHQLARILGFLSCRFAFMNVAVQCSLSMVEFTLQEIDFMKDYTASANRRRLNDVMNNTGLMHRVEFLASNLRHIALFGAIGQRMQTQQNVLFNLINIGMARDSKELAEASKRDSSSMKVIAVLTTLFLPGTFIASFFAMPLLNWNALSMTDVMTRHFWFYWAVAIPLTVFVMAIVGVYGLTKARENRKAAEKARKMAGFKEP